MARLQVEGQGPREVGAWARGLGLSLGLGAVSSLHDQPSKGTHQETRVAVHARLALTVTALHIQNCVGSPMAGFLVDSRVNTDCFMKALGGIHFTRPAL